MEFGQIISTGLTIASMVMLGGGFIWAVKANTMVLDARLAAHGARLDETNRQMQIMQIDLKKLNDVVTALALQDQRASVMEQRISAQGRHIEMLDQRFEELRHGEGFVHPLSDAMRARRESGATE